MVNKDIVYRHLQSLEESLSRIRQMDFTMKDVLNDIDIQDLLDRRMQRAIEAATDVAAHIVASKKLGEADSAGELFIILAKANIISENLGERLSQAVSFRNIIVHQYAAIDYHLAYSDLEKKLADLENFAKNIQQYLQSSD